jgi:hypothetical protein
LEEGSFTAASTILTMSAADPVTRPPITNIASFVVKTDNLNEVRKFYSNENQTP